MYVREAYRDRGAGARLAEAFLRWCRENGAERVRVTAYAAANEKAVRFYRHSGFQPKELTLEMKIPSNPV